MRNAFLLFSLLGASQIASPVFATKSSVNAREPVRTFSNKYNRFFDISPDGTKLAYIRSNSNKNESLTTPDVAELWVRIIATNALVKVSGTVSHDLDEPRWSPDGLKLAYTTRDNVGRKIVAVWDSRTGQTRHSAREPVGIRAGINDCLLQWSADSRQIYFIAAREDTIVILTDTRDYSKDDRGRHNSFMAQTGYLLYSGPGDGGITSLEHLNGKEAVKPAASDPRIDLIAKNKVDIISWSVDTGKARRIFTAQHIASFKLSPDGRMLFISAGGKEAESGNQRYVAQWTSSYYVVPVGSSRAAAQSASDFQGTAIDWEGRQVKPVVPLAKASFDPSQSWSPGSDSIAWVEQGGRSNGDLMVLDVAAGTVRNLTAGLELPLDARDARDAGGDIAAMRNAFNFHGKFGKDLQWSADGRTILLRRMVAVPRATNLYGMRGELWSVSVATGQARALISDPKFSVQAVMNDGGTAWSGAKDGKPLMAVRYISDNASGFVRFELATGKTIPVVRFRGTAARRGDDGAYLFNVASAGEAVLFENERSDVPPELQLLDATTGEIRQVTDVNHAWAARTMPVVRRVTYTAVDGSPSAGLLYLPLQSSAKGAGKPPVLLYIYPGSNSTKGVSDENYPGSGILSGAYMSAVLRPLLEAGYAILNPDIPFRGEGHACEEITANTVAALDAVGATGLVEATKAGVFGISFGGYSTNCVATHSGRFQAAVSMAGVSNWYDMDLAAGAAGGGQAKLGGTFGPESRELIDRYINDSPLYRASKITTPLLLLHGKSDQIAYFTQSLGMFRAMQRVRNPTPVKLVGYDYAGHDIDAHPDAPKQIVSWFDTYVKGVSPLAVSTPPKH